jgi:hypothetical protein
MGELAKASVAQLRLVGDELRELLEGDFVVASAVEDLSDAGARGLKHRNFHSAVRSMRARSFGPEGVYL